MLYFTNSKLTHLVKFLPFLSFLLIALPAFSQKKNEAYQYHIKRTNTPVVLDASLDDAAWQDAQLASNFWMVLPMDTSRSRLRTDVRMTYDAQHIYLSAICYYDSSLIARNAPPYIVESMRRDWTFGRNDNFLCFIDPFDDQTNGFAFGTNTVGAQWDGLMYEGGKVNLSWDNKWASVTRSYPDRYVIEMAIPFKTIRYKQGISRWGINFSRNDLNSTEKSAWAPVPLQFPTASLAYTGVLVWDQPPPSPGPNISVIPYALSSLNANYQGNVPTEAKFNAGLDAKVAVTSSLNLDLTVNPDFSQVDVDQQVTNLDRFELFFPERRQFFLENGDQFTNFGYATIRPFFSRRIGLGGVPIRFGARLSGKINKDWRFGLMDMQTGAVPNSGPAGETLPAQNFAVMALQRRVFSRSNIGVLFVNKQSMNYNPVGDRPLYSVYNRNLGFEYNLASTNNLWTGKLMYVKSFSPGVVGQDAVYAGNLQYSSRNWLLNGQWETVGPNYTAEAGYVPRRGYSRATGIANYSFFPTGTRILSHGPQLSGFYVVDPAGRRSDYEGVLGYQFVFRSRSAFLVWAASDYVRLLQPFDPTNTGREPLSTGSTHRWQAWGTTFISKPQQLFTYGFSTRYGGYYADGTRLNVTADLGYRFQPYVSLAVNANYNDIRLPAPWNNTKFWLVGPRFDLTMTNTLYLTTFIQYNEQQRNMNVNARIQWRYKPASDLFIVYTDNYLPTTGLPNMDNVGPFLVKNRAVVLKWTYWWNL
ncbi:hypothetical protein FAES_2836 [Fibrella aestuarina BUZ 2]|uniref:Uncharacterized protein n=1 Tax=Fibrella aestuarina BUZ 2 TaxID=1166018 RepID=I0K9P2_9BACT|nr:hypothetical protein FAES_2836 [Fibrella aestuarina BUZ 2]